MHEYLTDIPKNVEDFGFCKVLLVRREIIHIKHIFKEIFISKNIDINNYLSKLDYDLFRYMEIMTDRIRRIHHFPRTYRNNCNKIVKFIDKNFFPIINFYKDLENCIILDFDGVVTDERFNKLYHLCVERHKVFICSGNPTITEDYFIKRNLPLPKKIYSMKGKYQKIRCLIDLHRKFDNIFYVDNEKEYLEYAWLFGINTFQWNGKEIKIFTMKTK